MIIFWLCGGIALGAAAIAAFISDIRLAALALWLVGLASGGLYLSVGAEFLAILQWISSTVIAVGFIFYAMLFGEYRSRGAARMPARASREELRRQAIGWLRANLRIYLCAVLLGAGFLALVWRAADRALGTPVDSFQPGGGLREIGELMTNGHLLSLEILGLMLFLVIVGAGVVARPERSQERSPEGESL